MQRICRLFQKIGSRKSLFLRRVDALQLESLLVISELISVSFLARRETRGAHYRKDFEQTDNHNWLKNVIVSNKNGRIETSYAPLIITSFTPPEEV